MSYLSWFDAHAMKHKSIIAKLVACGNTKEQIIDYFVFENMVQNEPDFCPLYAKNEKCHDQTYLNCYFCACPHFRFDDAGVKTKEEKIQYSFCSIASQDGKQATYGDAIHQDCSACGIPHAKSYVAKKFDLDWKSVMCECKSHSIA